MSGPEDLAVGGGVIIPGVEVREAASRSSGPGGQHVNKTNTRVTLRWNLERSAAVGPVRRARLRRALSGRLTRAGDVVVHVGRHRSRARNREAARERLVELLREGLATRRRRRATRPTSSSKVRRKREKQIQAKRKQLRQPVHRDPGD